MFCPVPVGRVMTVTPVIVGAGTPGVTGAGAGAGAGKIH